MKRTFKILKSHSNMTLIPVEARIKKFIESAIPSIECSEFKDNYWITVLVEGTKQRNERIKRLNAQFGKRLGGNKNGI